MRWHELPYPVLGDTRTIGRFLVFPCRIGLEWRWLERVRIRQEFEEFWRFGKGGPRKTRDWVNKEFLP